MPDTKLNSLGASQAVRLIQRREINVVDLLEDCLAQIRDVDYTLKAWVHIAPEVARMQAQAVDKKIRANEKVGKLAGIPIGVKDIFNTKDMPTQMGSPIWKGFTPGNDARVVHYLRMADAIVLGKTVTAEFAVHTPGPTRNPHNPEYMPGTSSSGSAVAVAAYMVPLALGTQTAGSTLRPASYCGVYGFKPSFGLIPRTGMLKTTDTLDTVGFFARNVDDLSLMFDVIRVHGPDYPISYAALSDPRRQTKGTRPWKLAIVKGPQWGEVEEYAQRALYSYADDLAHLPGLEILEVALPEEFSRAHSVHSVIYDKALSYYFKEEFRQHTLISPIMYEIISRGNEISLDQYQAALKEQSRLAQKFDDLMKEYDALLTLTTGGAALKGIESADRPDTCLIWTLCGAPAIHLPVFTNADGMPFGAQVVARRYNDLLLLELVRFLSCQKLVPAATNPAPFALKVADV